MKKLRLKNNGSNYFGVFSLGILFFSLLSFHHSWAQITATVSRNPVGVGEQFQLTFTINGNASNFQAPAFKDFGYLGGPSVSNNMSFNNGNFSQSTGYTYYLQAKSEGTFKIESATASVNGKQIQSTPITITVVKGNPQQQKQGGQQDDGADNSGQLPPNSLYLKVSVDKSNVTRGEAIVATYKLYTRVNIVNYGLNKLPSLNGFWSQDIQMPQQLELHNENINGVQYRVGTIKKVVLFPQQSGLLTIDPMEGECVVRMQVQRKKSNNPFDVFNDPFFNDPFFGMGSARDVKYSLKSEPVKINVKELPANNDPSFNGAVGKMNMEAKFDRNEVNANDAVSLKIKISGKGNLKLIDPPPVNFPPDIEKYDPKINDNLNVSEAGVNGSKSFEYLLIPRHEGKYIIDPVVFTYYDLDKKQYVTLHSGPFELKVGKGSNIDGGAAVVQNKTEFQLLGKDIRFIKTTPLSFTILDNSFYGTPLFFLLLVVPFLLFVLLLIIKKKSDERNSDVRMVKSRKATKIAQRRLSAAKKFMDEKKNDLFFEEIFKALYGYLADKLSIPQSDLNKEMVVTRLSERKVPETTVQKLVSTLDFCELARFAHAGIGADPASVYRDSTEIISKIEDEIS